MINSMDYHLEQSLMDEQAFVRMEGKRKRCVEPSLSNRVHATMHTMVRTVQHTHVYITCKPLIEALLVGACVLVLNSMSAKQTLVHI